MIAVQPPTQLTLALGDHYIVELVDCDPATLEQVATVENILLDAAKQSHATVIDSQFKQFEPAGVSGVILIAESHFTIHTWPEHAYAAVDIFTCGQDMDADIAVHVLKRRFEAKNIRVCIIKRGI